MEFELEYRQDFIELFDRMKNKIRQRRGCHYLELVQGTTDDKVFFTISIWEDETCLDEYRSSKLFHKTWSLTKAMFSSKAEAWSTNSISILP